MNIGHIREVIGYPDDAGGYLVNLRLRCPSIFRAPKENSRDKSIADSEGNFPINIPSTAWRKSVGGIITH